MGVDEERARLGGSGGEQNKMYAANSGHVFDDSALTCAVLSGLVVCVRGPKAALAEARWP
jgi:hypothetical protein